MKSPRGTATSYALALAIIAAATVVRLLLDPTLGENVPYITYFPAVALAAWWGGLGPGLLVVALGGLAADYFFIPGHAFTPARSADSLSLALYLVLGTGIALLCESLREARQRAETRGEWLRVTLDSIGDGVIATDHHGRVTFINGVAEALTGWPLAEAKGKPLEVVFRIANEQTRMPAENPVAKVIREGVIVGLANHTALITRGETERSIADSAAPIRDGGGSIVGVVLVFRDITEKRAAERERERLMAAERAAHEKTRDVLEGMTDCYFAIDRHWRIADMNPQAEQVFGRSREEYVGKFMWKEYPQAVGSEFYRQYHRAMAEGVPVHFEAKSAIIDRWFEAHAYPSEAGLAVYLRDITERKRAEEASREAARRVEAMLESITDAFEAFDADWRFTYVNAEAERVIGRSRNDLLGKNHWEVHTPTVGTQVEREFKRAVAEQVSVAFENYYEPWDKWFDVRAYPVEGGGLSVFFRDITEQKRAERRADEARAAAEAANRAKDAFLAALSHELRTPLTPVLASVTDLQGDARLPVNLRDEIAMIRRNVEMEARLIDDLLDLTRITRGTLELRPADVELHRLVREAINICRADITEKALTVAVDLRAKRHRVTGDQARLLQVLWNLLKNAVKFTPPGGSITVATEDAEGGRLRVRVRDTGVGITPEALPRIFDAFERGDKQFGGLGLGLAISRAIVDTHGGTLMASSDGPGAGATFTLELPGACEPIEAAERPGGDTRAGRLHRPLRILLVEDHEDTVRVLSRLLRRSGHEVVTADSVSAGLEAASAGAFDLLISDLGLPDGSGLEVMRRLRPLPGIALSGYGMEADIREAREAGFSAHLTKPIDFPKLEAAIREVANHQPGA